MANTKKFSRPRHRMKYGLSGLPKIGLEAESRTVIVASRSAGEWTPRVGKTFRDKFDKNHHLGRYNPNHRATAYGGED